MIHNVHESDLGYKQVITEPEEVTVVAGETLVKDTDGAWYNCHPKPLEDCAMRRAFPQGGYGVRFKL